MPPPSSTPLLLPFLLLLLSHPSAASPHHICVIGAGISGSSVSHFLKTYSPDPHSIRLSVFERNPVVGGRMATVCVGGDTFEAGASIIHPKNYHALNFTSLLNLRPVIQSNSSDASSCFGIWDGSRFVFRTISSPSPKSGPSFYQKIVTVLNSLLVLARYGFSILRMEKFVHKVVGSFLRYYEDFGSRPVFSRVEDMLKWSGLYGMTRRTLEEELVDAGLSQRLISELVTLITRINYGQSVSISGLAGAVSLAGSDSGLWSVEGGNWQIAAGLLRHSNASLHLNEEITSVSYDRGLYELNSTKGNSYRCDVTVVATPLDELKISFNPSISVPKRMLQHTHATFVRGLLNPAYFGLNSISEIPELVGTIEAPHLPFSSISILKKSGEEDLTYKVFSRVQLADELLDQIFSTRKETIHINWAAYPHFLAPEVFAPFLLDGLHLYYINAFENAASTIETGAVAAENVARLILSRISHTSPQSVVSNEAKNLHDDL